MALLLDRLEVRSLPGHEGHEMCHQRHRISDNTVLSTVLCRYEGEIADGFQAVFISSQGNEAQFAAHQGTFGTDEVVQCHLMLTCYKPYQNGIELKQIINIEKIDGKVSKDFSQQLLERMANDLIVLVDYLMGGTLPA